MSSSVRSKDLAILALTVQTFVMPKNTEKQRWADEEEEEEVQVWFHSCVCSIGFLDGCCVLPYSGQVQTSNNGIQERVTYSTNSKGHTVSLSCPIHTFVAW